MNTITDVKMKSIPPTAPASISVGPFGAGAVALAGEQLLVAYLGGARRAVPAPNGEVVAVGLVGAEPAALLRDGRLLVHSKRGWKESSALFDEAAK